MKGLELIRAQIEKSKADRARNSEKAKVSTMKVYPLRNQDQNRLVQVMHRESFSASDIYTTKLHRGILIDWLSGNVQDGRIFLPASGVMAVVTAALWNSRAHFNHLSTTPSFMENAKASWSNVSSIALSDFSFLVDSLEVLDTRAPNVIQSHATCLQTVIGDNGLITVYHKLLDGSVRQIAKGRASAITEEVPLTLQWDAPVAGLEVKMAPYATLHHCYDVPPPLMKIAYQHAISTFFPSTSSVPKLTVYSIIESVRNLWVNHAQLGMLWECGKCQIHAQMKADDRCAVVFAISIAQGSQTSYGSQPPSSLASLVVYGELQISSSAVRQMSLPISGMWVLRSSWENDCEGGSSALVAEAAVEGTSAAAQENKMLLIGAPEHCAAVAHSITAQAPSLLCKVHSEPFPVSLHDTPDDHFAFAATAESKVYKSIVFLLPDSEMLHDKQLSLRSVLAVLKSVCRRCNRLLVVSTAPTESGGEGEGNQPSTFTSRALADMFGGALLTAQLEYFKCTMTMCHISLPISLSPPPAQTCLSPALQEGTNSICAEVLLHELGLTCISGLSVSTVGRDMEVLYHCGGSDAPTWNANSLVRKVRRYHHFSCPTYPPLLDQDGVYIITGGLGGIGLLTAQCLVRSGARKLVLLSRSGSVPYKGQGLEEMLQTVRDAPGVQLRILQCDVSVEDIVVRMLAEVRTFGPIMGIIHAAGVLSDGLIVTGNAEEGAQAVWNAKAKSAELLHKHTQQDLHHLRMFLMFSSVTAAVGTAGQSAYAAANRYLESLVTERRRVGQCGLCVRWPEVSGVGMAAALHGSNKGASGGGDASDRTCAVSAAQVETFLLELFARSSATAATEMQDSSGAVLTLMPPALVELYRGSRMGTQLQAVPVIGGVAAVTSKADVLASSSSMHSAGPNGQAEAVTRISIAPSDPIFSGEQIRATLHRILSTLLDEHAAEAQGGGGIPDDALLMQMGLDSLGATELASLLSEEFSLKVPSTLIFSYPTSREIVEYIQSILGSRAGRSAPAPPSSLSPQQLLSGSVPPALVPAGSVSSSVGAPVGGVLLDDVAIIGTSMSFPGNCNTLHRLWEILLNKESTSVPTPADRWDVDALLAANNVKDPLCKDRLKSAHFLTHEEPFNCQQFNMTAKEAAVMHPSHRLLLINCLRALQDSGYAGDKLCTNTGVYVGIGGVVSGTGSAASPPGGYNGAAKASTEASMSAYSATSHSISVSAGRISFSLGLSGPCMAIDTACSSSLVALHAARRALQLGECDLALVCGVNCLDASSSLACAVAGMTSPEGVCRTFDQTADGYSRAEGCGVLLLKRLGDAVRDGDGVHCVVRGSAVKQDGKSASLTAPNGRAQQELLLAALKDARLQPHDVQLLETHGTGTKLGDPVETAAIAAVFGNQRPPHADSSGASPPLYLTGIKANMGHLEAGAGIAGLFSILLALEQRTAPPNALLQVLNEKVAASLGDTSMVPITAPTPLVCPVGRLLVAGVSSFGYSGTIAHVLLEEPPQGVRRRNMTPAVTNPGDITENVVFEMEAQPTAARSGVIKLSNSSSGGTAISSDNKSAEGNNHGEDDCDGVSSEGDEDENEDEGEGNEDQVWQFAGQGDLKVGAGKELFDTEESFRSAMARCDTIVRPILGRTISEMLYPPGFQPPARLPPTNGGTAPRVSNSVPTKCPDVVAAEALLSQTMYSQVALVVLEYCLAAVWLAQGMQPGVVLGHSLGEYAAAVVAGVLTLEDALRLVCERGRLVQQDKRCEGVMYAVRAYEEHVLQALATADPDMLARASLAASNGKMSVVLSGAEVAVKKLITLLPAKSASIKLGVIHAFHSPLLQCVVPLFQAVLNDVTFAPLSRGVRFISAVRGREVSSAELAAPQYWTDHMLLPVQYMRAVEVAFRAGGRTFVEMGPHDTLTKLSNRLLFDLDKAAVENGEEKVNFETLASIV